VTLAQALAARRRQGRAGFVPFLMAGDPSLAHTASLARRLAAAGADILELGVPFSDPVADGPVIQASSQRALRSGATLSKVLAVAARLKKDGFAPPIVLFTYLNPVLALGVERFAGRCRDAGISGVLAVDLPVEEAALLSAPLARRGVEPVLLASPTTSARRLELIGKATGSVLYYVCRRGVTGARRGLPEGLPARLREVRRRSGKPLLVGFGVSGAEQARALAPHADGVVVGSALVELSGKPRACETLSRRIISGLGAGARLKTR